MGAAAGVDEGDDAEAVRVDDPDAVRHHVGDVEHAAVRRELHVLRHAEPVPRAEHLDDALAGHVQLEQLPRELAADERLRPVGGEVHVVDSAARRRNGLDERKRVRVAEVQPCVALGDDDRVAPVGREVHVVGIARPGSCASASPVCGLISVKRVAGVVRDIQVLEVVRRDDVLRQPPDREVIDDLVRLSDRSRRPCSDCEFGT